MKLRRILAVLAVIFACTVLVSAAPADRLYAWIGSSARLVKTEYKNILSFFGDKQYSTEERGTALPATQTDGSVPMLTSSLHTEVLPSPFNRADKPATVASAGGCDLTGMGETPLSESEKLGYAAVPVFIDRSVSEISRILSSHGISFTTVTRKNTAPVGEVFAMRYAGMSDPTGYCINPAISVTLYVSAPKEATVTADGDCLVYLTFDDGPSAAHTEQILDTLDTYGIKGAFFTLGTAIENHPELAAQIKDRGHVLGCHTMTHVYDDIYSSAWALGTEIDGWEAAVADAGIDPGETKVFRFPGGSVGSRLTADKKAEMKQMLTDRGYRIYDWNVSINDAVLYLAPDGVTSYDYIRGSFTESLETALASHGSRPGEPIIILMHESGDETPELLTWLIEYIRGKGLRFGNLANLDESYMFSD